MELVQSENGDKIVLKLVAPEYSIELADRRRKKVLTKELTVNQKMDIYTASTKGKYKQMVEIIEEK